MSHKEPDNAKKCLNVIKVKKYFLYKSLILYSEISNVYDIIDNNGEVHSKQACLYLQFKAFMYLHGQDAWHKLSYIAQIFPTAAWAGPLHFRHDI